MKKIKKLFKIIAILLVVFLVYTNFDLIKNKFNNIYDKAIDYANKNGLDELRAKGYLISDKEVNSLDDSGITGDNVTIDAVMYPYYTFLTSDEQTIYRQIYANAEKLETTFVPSVSVHKDNLQNIVEAVYNDHPEIFWFDTSYGYRYTEDGNIVQIILKFNETINNINEAKALFEGRANNIINMAKELNTNYEKEKYVHDAIINFAFYDINASLNQSAYSALVNGETVCAGYARSFQYIMIELGIPTYYVVGTANGPHAWNIVTLEDGYYNVDLTWDDTKTSDYDYFNLTDEKLSNHTRSEISNKLPKCTSTTYEYGYLDKAGDIIRKVITKHK